MTINNFYSQKTLAYFQKPKHFGKIKKPSGIGEVGNLTCGDMMKLYIKVEKNKKKEDYIKDIKFETFGCVAAIASSDSTAEIAKGKTINQALKISPQMIIKKIGGLPQPKIHCSILAIDALTEAIFDFLKKQKKKIPKKLINKHRIVRKNQKILEERYFG